MVGEVNTLTQLAAAHRQEHRYYKKLRGVLDVNEQCTVMTRKSDPTDRRSTYTQHSPPVFFLNLLFLARVVGSAAVRYALTALSKSVPVERGSVTARTRH